MITELGFGQMGTSSYDLYPELVRQFMATVHVHYVHERAKIANEGTLAFFIRGISYRLPLTTLCEIYGFENPEYTCYAVPAFPGQSHFLGLLAAGYFDSGTATQTDIRYPQQGTVQELTLLYYAVRDSQ